jgi:UDP-glucose:(heptosyl)LPS alpha-1,3-glucosyltransferase
MIVRGASESAREITFVANEVGLLGGMESQLRRLVLGCLDDGRSVTLITREHDLPEHPRLRTVNVPGPARPMALAGPSFELAAGALLLANRRGVVHACGGIVPCRADVVAVQFCHAWFNSHVSGSRARKENAAYLINAALARRMNQQAENHSLRPGRVRAIVALSDGLAAEVCSSYPSVADRVVCIPNGVDSSRFRPNQEFRNAARRRWSLADDALVAIFVGGDWPRKGLGHAIEAVARSPKWNLIVVGDGDSSRYRALASSLGADDRVQFIGKQSAVDKEYAGADLFILPTQYETFSLVTFEAAAAGLPVLVTPVSGPTDLIKHGENGYFLNDDSNLSAELLSRLAADPALRARMGGAARVSVESFSWERCVQSHLDLYDRLSRDQ